MFPDYRQLVALPEIDAVSVCTPNSLHHPVTLAAAAAGKHVLCEKPISLSLAEADEMIEACRIAGVVLQINHHLRSNPAVTRTREMLDDGALGRVAFIRLRQAHDWGGAAALRPTFQLRSLAGGGTLLDNGCHLFDLVRHLAGPVAEVFCRIGTLKFETELEDLASVSLELESGALGELEAAWTATGWEEGFAIYGTQGSLEYSNRTGRRVLRHLFRDPVTTSWSEPAAMSWELDSGGQSDYVRHVAAFIAAIEGRADVACTGEDGREAVRLVLASYESARHRLPVRPDAIS
jgi:predicted dehydrogenase